MAKKKVQRGSWYCIWHTDNGGWLELRPKHQNTQLAINKGSGLQVIRDIEPFRNIAVDNQMISGRRQKRDMMRAHGLTEVGNEPPVHRMQEFPDNHRERVADIKQAYREHGVDIL